MLEQVADDEGEIFIIITTDPAASSIPGYLWSTSEPLTESEARQSLGAILLDASSKAIDEMFSAARGRYAVNRRSKPA